MLVYSLGLSFKKGFENFLILSLLVALGTLVFGFGLYFGGGFWLWP